MTALVGGEAIDHGAIGGLLQVEVERGVDAQAGLVHLLGAEALFELAPDLFLKPGSDATSAGCAMWRPSGALRACSAWAWVMTPSDSISVSTRLRRRSALSGLSKGE